MGTSVSVIILNYNGQKILGETLLYRFLSSVLNSEYPNFEVLFVDNGSTDGSIEYVRKMFKDEKNLKIIANSNNYGFAVGNNKALENASGRYIILLNNDVEVDPSWITELVNVIENDQSIGTAQGKEVSFDRTYIESVGTLLDTSLTTYNIGHMQKDKGQYNRISEVTYATGSGLIISRSLIDKIGLFDPNYFFYHDDCDLGWRVRLAGLRNVVVPSSVTYHKGQVTSSVSLEKNQGSYLGFCSRIGLLIKNLELKNIPKFGVIMLVNMGWDCLFITLKGDTKLVKNLVVWTIKNFKVNWQSRMIVQNCIRKVDDKNVLKYFLNSSLVGSRIASNLAGILIAFHLSKQNKNQPNIDFAAKELQTTYNYYRAHSKTY